MKIIFGDNPRSGEKVGGLVGALLGDAVGSGLAVGTFVGSSVGIDVVGEEVVGEALVGEELVGEILGFVVGYSVVNCSTICPLSKTLREDIENTQLLSCIDFVWNSFFALQMK
mmetsp:Transcript_15022/g.17580  ORF Transcript_15022/g.17580 Transcript_15022/m.17580 type:complete len:113 (-) Transcript_15022:80-418(-)